MPEKTAKAARWNAALVVLAAAIVAAATPAILLGLVLLEWAIFGNLSHRTEEFIHSIGLTGPVAWLYALLGGNG